MNRDWIDSFPKNIPECIIHKILNLRPIHPVAELLKPEFDLLMRDVDTYRYPIVKEGDIFKRFMSHARNCPRGFKWAAAERATRVSAARVSPSNFPAPPWLRGRRAYA